ncbi:MAG: ThuA domain-containing protein [Verrucomicrobiota bacterium]
MKIYLILFFAVSGLFSTSLHTFAEEAKPLNILLINGGCCHDYDAQGPVIKAIVETSLNAKVTIASSTNKTDARFKPFEQDNWSDGYDLVIHNECSAKVNDKEYVNRILKAHLDGLPSLNIHCAMHSYRWGSFKKPVKIGDDNAAWFEMIGLQSSGHGPRFPINVKYLKDTHPITEGLEDWVTPRGELYNNVQIFDSATPLAMGSQTLKDGEMAEAVVAWTNLYGPNKTKIFSISIGHSSEEMLDESFGLLLSRGILWCVGELD